MSSSESLLTCVNPKHSFIHILVKEQQICAFVEKKSVTKQQLIQIMSFVPKVIIPKLKIKLNDNFCYTIDSNERPIATNSNTKRFKFDNNCLSISNNSNYINKSDKNWFKESSNLWINGCAQEKRLSAESDDNQMCYSNRKRKSISNETHKENTDCNQELLRGIGLPNLGNTCYVNSIIQGLHYCYDYCYKSINPLICFSVENNARISTIYLFS